MWIVMIARGEPFEIFLTHQVAQFGRWAHGRSVPDRAPPEETLSIPGRAERRVASMNVTTSHRLTGTIPTKKDARMLLGRNRHC